jgi:hypothetical protein
MDDDLEDDPLNQGGQRDWGSPEMMEEFAYLMDDTKPQVGPVNLLGGALGVVRSQPLVLLLVGVLSGASFFAADTVIAAPVSSLLGEVFGDTASTAIRQLLVMMVVFSVALLLQGPVLGAAFAARIENRKGLVGLYGKRAVAHFKGLAVVSGLNTVISIAGVLGWVLGVWVLVQVGDAIGGLMGGLIIAVGMVALGLYAMAMVLRFAFAAPAMLVERLDPIPALKRSAALTKGTSLALAAAMIIPIVLFVMGTLFLSFFGMFQVAWVPQIWTLGFDCLYMMIAIAIVPSGYLVYRHFVDEKLPRNLVEG